MPICAPDMSLQVRLAGIVPESVTDGPGLRIALFFQGCAHHCPGCHNPQTWPMQGGESYAVETLLHDLPVTPLVQGVTLSGGDPFYQPEAAAAIARALRARGKDVWGYTGFTWEELLAEADPARMDLLRQCDVLVDGPYVQEQRDLTLPFCGSRNQRLIAVPASLASGAVRLWTRA
jgi:anaerobic ribonucleoside-triphosphate reductase activating protein